MSYTNKASNNACITEGKYTNHFEIGHNAYTFVIDFGQMFAQRDEPQIHTRIVTTPIYARDLLETLQESIKQYEQTFGTIKNGTELAGTIGERNNTNGSDACA